MVALVLNFGDILWQNSMSLFDIGEDLFVCWSCYNLLTC